MGIALSRFTRRFRHVRQLTLQVSGSVVVQLVGLVAADITAGRTELSQTLIACSRSCIEMQRMPGLVLRADTN